MKTIKAFLKQLIDWAIRIFDKTAVGRYVYAHVLRAAVNRTMTIGHSGLHLTFATPNALNKYRADTFATKEPETLEWIDRMPENVVLWDIGANVGLYSCYAAKARGCRVFAFEPSVFNLELLARNIFLNGLTDNITIVPLPLAEKLEFNTLNMTNTEWGGALSTFGQSYGHDGREMKQVFQLPTVGMSMVDAAERLHIPQPDFIKMDVDGIEHLILRGGGDVLKRATGLLVEINDRFDAQQYESRRLLEQAGFSLQEKRHAAYFDTYEDSARHTYNQIWTKVP